MKNHTVKLFLFFSLLISCAQVNTKKVSVVESSPLVKARPLSLSKIDQTIEKNHYQNLLNAFHRNDARAFHVAFQKIKKLHLNGAYIDNAYYLSGMWHFSKKEYGLALKEFHTVVSKYPKSDQASSALFAKGAVLLRMNLPQQAKSIFQLVRRQYPNSKESWRAQAELNSIR